MGFLQRLLSSDYRQALAAEAASDFALAARLYAQCGETLKVAEMHLLRVRPEAGREDNLRALREAARWGAEALTRRPEEAAQLLCKVARGLSREARRDAPTVATELELLREAASLYECASALREAAECFESIGELLRAAELYGRAGDLSRMEALLDREREQARSAFELREAWEQYRMELLTGRRSVARAALQRCAASPMAGAERAEYLRLLEELGGRWLSGGHVTLRVGLEAPTVYTRLPVVLGRDGASGLALRDGSVSRHHARISLRPAGPKAASDGAGPAPGDGPRLVLCDCGSKNGTRLGGLPIGGEITLGERGEIALGDDCVLEFEWRAGTDGGRLELRVVRGRERGWRLCAQDAPFALSPTVDLRFVGGQPVLRNAAGPFTLGGVPAAVEVELLRSDRVGADGTSWEVV
jgi:hypothetical protein